MHAHLTSPHLYSMAGMLHTAEAYSRGIRSLRQRVADTWMSAGSEWQSLPLLLVRYAGGTP